MEGTRTYNGVTRVQVISAAEQVLEISDPQDWEFRHQADGFTGLRRYVVYSVIALTSGREKWEFSTEKLGSKSVRASVFISESGVASGGYSATPYERKLD